MANSILGDKLAAALENKKNDVNSFIWKGPKKYINGERVQEEFKLMDATEEQLKKCYAHCKSMLYSKDRNDPGRYELIKIIREQQFCCAAELYMRYLKKKGTVILEFRKALTDYLDTAEVKEKIPRSAYRITPISTVIEIPDEFKAIPIQLILNACLGALGEFKRKHITNNFLVKLGLWFTKEEIKDYLSQKDSDGNIIDKLEQVKSNLNLRPNIILHTDYNGGLSYLEFRSIYMLHQERYEYIGDLALNTLKNKVLPRLEDEARKQAELWEQKISEIKKVCEVRQISYE